MNDTEERVVRLTEACVSLSRRRQITLVDPVTRVLRVEVEEGLSPDEITSVARALRPRLPKDLAAFLSSCVPRTPGYQHGFPEWRDVATDVAARQERAVQYAVDFIVGTRAWCRQWGDRPDDLEEARLAAEVGISVSPPFPFLGQYYCVANGPTAERSGVVLINRTNVKGWNSDFLFLLERSLGGAFEPGIPQIPTPWADIATSRDYPGDWPELSDEDQTRVSAVAQAVLGWREESNEDIVRRMWNAGNQWCRLAWSLTRGASARTVEAVAPIVSRQALARLTAGLPEELGRRIEKALAAADEYWAIETGTPVPT